MPAYYLVLGREASDYVSAHGGRRLVNDVLLHGRRTSDFDVASCYKHLDEKRREPTGKMLVEILAEKGSPRFESLLRRVRDADGRGEAAQDAITEKWFGRRLQKYGEGAD